jgi:hypothetical protein
VSFQLIDGIRVTGELRDWNDEGIDGSFGRRRWSEIRYRDVWRLLRRLSADGPADAWIDAGRTLLIVALDQPDAAPYAERAFRQALAVAGAVAPEQEETERARLELAIADARGEVEDVRMLRLEADRLAAAERLTTVSPEAGTWAPNAWPVLTAPQQEAATDVMRTDAAGILEAAGLALEPIETDYFLFYSEMSRRESVRWASELDLMYKRLAEKFALAPGANIFWGKAVIFVFNDRDRYRLVEAEAFGHLAPDWADGFCHPMGPKVFVSFYRQPNDERFAAVLVHETVHGFLHRYRNPRRLPTWANEGFADYLAAVIFRNSPVDPTRRRIGVRFVRNGGSVDSILSMSYRDGSWPGPDNVGYGVGYLLVELMMRERPGAFAQWVNAIKDGKDWELALKEDFGVGRERLVETFKAYYRVND